MADVIVRGSATGFDQQSPPWSINSPLTKRSRQEGPILVRAFELLLAGLDTLKNVPGGTACAHLDRNRRSSYGARWYYSFLGVS